jgi:AbrB family looped-hinge helix DNA binding protein
MKVAVTGKGRMTIPSALRRKFGIRKGTRILMTDEGGEIRLEPMTEGYYRKLQGSLKGTGLLKTRKGMWV